MIAQSVNQTSSTQLNGGYTDLLNAYSMPYPEDLVLGLGVIRLAGKVEGVLRILELSKSDFYIKMCAIKNICMYYYLL